MVIPDGIISKVEKRAEKEEHGGGLCLRNCHNEYFSFDARLSDEEWDGVPWLNKSTSHPEIPAKYPGVAVMRNETASALEGQNSDDDPNQLERVIDNADFDPVHVGEQDTSETSDHSDDA